MTISRREWLRSIGGTAVCACLSALGLGGCARTAHNIPPAPDVSYRREGGAVIVTLSEVEELRAVGGAIRLELDSDKDTGVKILVVHPEKDVYRAYANRCTHRGKELSYLHEGQRLQCRSRKARFDLDGRVLKGPAESQLTVYRCRRVGDDLVIEV